MKMTVKSKANQLRKPNKAVKLSQVIEFPTVSDSLVANKNIHGAIDRLRDVGRKIKAMQMIQKSLQDELKAYMGNAFILIDIDGTLAATWKYNKDSVKVDDELLQNKFPDIYEKVLKTVAGSRVFNVK